MNVSESLTQNKSYTCMSSANNEEVILLWISKSYIHGEAIPLHSLGCFIHTGFIALKHSLNYFLPHLLSSTPSATLTPEPHLPHNTCTLAPLSSIPAHLSPLDLLYLPTSLFFLPPKSISRRMLTAAGWATIPNKSPPLFAYSRIWNVARAL